MRDIEFQIDTLELEDYFREVDEVEDILRETGFNKALEDYDNTRGFKIEDYWGDF